MNIQKERDEDVVDVALFQSSWPRPFVTRDKRLGEEFDRPAVHRLDKRKRRKRSYGEKKKMVSQNRFLEEKRSPFLSFPVIPSDIMERVLRQTNLYNF